MRQHIQDNNPVVREKVTTKMKIIVLRNYLTGGVIISMIYFFAVPKVTEEIRIFFGGLEDWKNTIGT